ncbi:MAG: phosphoribosylamine--glycine ligase [Ignavibacteriaceae bacterium]
MKNVLLTGSGGREHALAYKISQSNSLNKLYIAPGNPGTKKLGENVSLNPDDFNSVISFCNEKDVNLVVIGPEKPLVDGLADVLRKNNINVFGPNKDAAAIEGYKTFAKYLMKKYNIPTAGYSEFTFSQISDAEEFLKKSDYPVVIKADGLAAGKGVIICNNLAEGLSTLNDMFVKKAFGSAGEKIIIEEFLIGEEASIFAITDGDKFLCLPSSQDHKRIGDNDTGKNTGGMGAYSPAPLITKEILDRIENEIISPVLSAMNKEGKKFNGCLYCGLMINEGIPKVVEFNCRFGDPETQAVLPLLEGDFLELLYSAAIGNLNKDSVHYSGGSSVCVVAASKGYPEKYEKGFEIAGLDNVSNDIIIFHAGTKEDNGRILTNGGRVLGVTSLIKNNDLRYAKQKSYEALSKINYKGIYYRKDISDKAFKN